MEKMRLMIALWLLMMIHSVAAKDTSVIYLPYWPGNSFVPSCGTQYRDASKFQCYDCPANQEIDPATLGGDGQFDGCICSIGFANVQGDCSNVSIFSPILNSVYLFLFLKAHLFAQFHIIGCFRKLQWAYLHFLSRIRKDFLQRPLSLCGLWKHNFGPQQFK